MTVGGKGPAPEVKGFRREDFIDFTCIISMHSACYLGLAYARLHVPDERSPGFDPEILGSLLTQISASDRIRVFSFHPNLKGAWHVEGSFREHRSLM